MLEFSKKHEVKLVATNNTFYLDNSSADAHDILLCVKEGEKLSTPKGRGRGFRFGLPNNEYYFKTQDQMKEIFVTTKCYGYGVLPLVRLLLLSGVSALVGIADSVSSPYFCPLVR